MRYAASSQRIPAPIESRKVEIVSHTFEMITPVLGGGVRSKKGDPITPIRPTSIKGQLRFWWRAARAGGKTLEELIEEEKRLWGGPNREGVLSISLNTQPQVVEESWFELSQNGKREEVRRSFRMLGYAAFSIKRTNEEVKEGIPERKLLRCTGKMTLTIRVNTLHPNYQEENGGDKKEAEAALWAWSCFGGVGGRTRRGFGALNCDVEGSPDKLLASEYIIDKEPPEGVPSLAPKVGARLIVKGAENEADKAWRKAIEPLQQFRQGLGFGRNHPADGKYAGRSRWPEADVIRHELKASYQGFSTHKQRMTSEPVKKAPRGQFGMPIIFHFADKELGDVTLKPKSFERYASPLILKAMGKAHTYYPIALLLGNRPNLDDLEGGCVMEQKNAILPLSLYLSDDESHCICPMHRHSKLKQDFLSEEAPTDPLLKFLAYFGQ